MDEQINIALYKDEICALLNAAQNQQARYDDNPSRVLADAIASLTGALLDEEVVA